MKREFYKSLSKVEPMVHTLLDHSGAFDSIDNNTLLGHLSFWYRVKGFALKCYHTCVFDSSGVNNGSALFSLCKLELNGPHNFVLDPTLIYIQPHWGNYQQPPVFFR